MEVMRNMTIDTELFELGDIISFTLTTGEKVKAKAIRETPNGMLFITVDCLKDEQKMFENPGRAEKVDYEHSDLRKKLNGEIFESFPEEIKGRMVGMRVGQTNCFDMLRIPTEREIFGENFTKKTDIWGYFNEPKKCPRKMTEDEKLLSARNNRVLPQLPEDYVMPDGWNVQAARRSMTSAKFAEAFYKANK